MSKHRVIPPVPTAPPGSAVHGGLHTGPLQLEPVYTASLTMSKSIYADGAVVYTVGFPGEVIAHTQSPDEALTAVIAYFGMVL